MYEALFHYMSDFGIPRVLLVDDGGEFTAQAFHSLCKTHMITVAYTTRYYPQGNSVSERMHRTLKSILVCLFNGDPLRWPKLLSQCRAVMNTVVHMTTGQQPYFASFRATPFV